MLAFKNKNLENDDDKKYCFKITWNHLKNIFQITLMLIDKMSIYL